MKKWRKPERDPFVRQSALPEGPGGFSYSLPGSDIRYAVTGDYMDRARNHCASVCTANLVLYFRSQEKTGNSEKNVRRTREELEALKREKALFREAVFTSAYRALGDGPVFRIAKTALRELADRGIRAEASGISRRDRSALLQALHEGMPCAILIRISPFNWHWILAVGYRRYENGRTFLQVSDSWNPRADRYLELTGAFFPGIIRIIAFRRRM